MKSVFENRKKRSRDEIIASIVLTSKNGTSKTNMMYASYLSFSQLNKYISYSLRAKLIFKNDEGKYVATSKGIEYLKCFEDVQTTENSAFEKRKLLEKILASETQT
jgi:predicted transcriptional regulator